jgi:hypothetical protein
MTKCNVGPGAGNGPGWEALTAQDEAERGELLKAKVRVKARVVESARLRRAARAVPSRAL